MTEEKLRVLLLDDKEDLRVGLTQYLQDNCGYQVDSAARGQEALQLVKASHGLYDVALLDHVLEEEPDGIQVMREIKRQYPDIECIIFTGWGYDSAMEALRAGAYRYLAKPVDYVELGLIIGAAAEHRKLKRELETTKQEKEWLQTFLEIGKATTSVKFDQVLEQVRQQIGKLVDVAGLCIVLYDEKRQMLDCELCYDRGERQPAWRRPFAADTGLIDWVIAHQQPLLICDYANDPLPIPIRQLEPEVKSWLGIPLAVQDRVIGALIVRSYRPPIQRGRSANPDRCSEPGRDCDRERQALLDPGRDDRAPGRVDRQLVRHCDRH